MPKIVAQIPKEIYKNTNKIKNIITVATAKDFLARIR